MIAQSEQRLTARKCKACHGDAEKYSLDEANSQLAELPDWQFSHDGTRIRRNWEVKDFMAGIDFFRRIAEVAEQEDHHPDLHLEGYRHVWVELSTHAAGGLTENDFILAAKIDQLPVEVKR